jgi:hypothetical protein
MNDPAFLVPLYKRVSRLPHLSNDLNITCPKATLYLRVIPDITPSFPQLSNMEIVEDESTRYAIGINLLARVAFIKGHEWLFVGADDLRPHHRWFEEALKVHEETGAIVIGTNDMHNPRVIAGDHATHFLVHSSFLEQGSLDGPGTIMSEAYQHCAVDDELRATAMHRGVYAHARHSLVEHEHVLWGFGDLDETYARGGMNEKGMVEDVQLFKQRMKEYGIEDVRR